MQETKKTLAERERDLLQHLKSTEVGTANFKLGDEMMVAEILSTALEWTVGNVTIFVPESFLPAIGGSGALIATSLDPFDHYAKYPLVSHSVTPNTAALLSLRATGAEPFRAHPFQPTR